MAKRSATLGFAFHQATFTRCGQVFLELARQGSGGTPRTRHLASLTGFGFVFRECSTFPLVSTPATCDQCPRALGSHMHQPTGAFPPPGTSNTEHAHVANGFLQHGVLDQRDIGCVTRRAVGQNRHGRATTSPTCGAKRVPTRGCHVVGRQQFAFLTIEPHKLDERLVDIQDPLLAEVIFKNEARRKPFPAALGRGDAVDSSCGSRRRFTGRAVFDGGRGVGAFVQERADKVRVSEHGVNVCRRRCWSRGYRSGSACGCNSGRFAQQWCGCWCTNEDELRWWGATQKRLHFCVGVRQAFRLGIPRGWTRGPFFENTL